VVTVEGSEHWEDWTQHYGWFYEPMRKGQPTHLLLRGGDVLFPSESAPFLYQDSDGKSLSLVCNKDRIELNGKIISLMLEKEDSWDWLEKANNADLGSLRLIVIGNEIDERSLQSLRRLSHVNPGVALFFLEKVSLQQVLPLFDPAWLFCYVRAGDPAILEKKRNIKDLTTIVDAKDWSFLTKLPNLETLTIWGWDPAVSGRFPENLHRLKRLSLMNPKAENLALLGKQPGLDELILQGDCRVNSLDEIFNFPDLKVLTLSSCKDLRDLSPLKQLKKLKWLGLPPSTTQEQLENVLRDHPDLLGLELLKANAITDLSPLKELMNLRYLTVDTPNAKLDPLFTMRGLRWLGVGVDDRDVDILAKIQQALPETSVVRANPVCLGSGWIFLLIPGVLLASWMQKRRRKAAQKGGGNCDAG
jgi:hypothetical protein